MSALLYRINDVLSRVVSHVPVGTNLGLFHLLWTLLSGRLLQSRGAVIPALLAPITAAVLARFTSIPIAVFAGGPGAS